MKRKPGAKIITKRSFSIGWTGFCIAILLSLPSCFEPESGCLNTEALNYALDADNPCSDCCEFPSLVLDVQHRFVRDSLTEGVLPGNTTHLDDFDQVFQFKTLRYFISNLHLTDNTGQTLEVEEELGLVVIEGSRIRLDTVEDNFALVDATQLSDYTIGTIKGGGDFVSVGLDFGLVDPTSKSDINELPDGHPLSEPDLYIDDDQGYVFFEMELYRDTSQLSLDSVKVQLDKTLVAPQLNFPIDFSLNPGFNTEVILRIDYAALLEGVNVRLDTEEQIQDKIVNNLTNAFLVIDVTANNR